MSSGAICPKCSAAHADLRSDGKPRCHAHSKRSGKQCGSVRIRDKEVCHYHGGKSLEGAANPNFKNGRYDRFLQSGKFGERARRFLNDPDVLSLLPNLAIVDARISEILESLTAPRAIAAWDEIGETVQALERGRARGDKEVQAAALARLIQIGKFGRTLSANMRELIHQQEQRRKLVETEARRQASEEATITYERAASLFHYWLDVLFRHVADRETRAAIMQDIKALGF